MQLRPPACSFLAASASATPCVILLGAGLDRTESFKSGTSEGPEAPFGIRAPGGFDCSGFVWNVYKLHAYAGAPHLADVVKGRTTMEMSGEVPKKLRIPLEKLAPGDVLFFGVHGPKSKPGEVDHAGIYLGSGWFIHSSGYGVAVAQLDGWYAEGFAWARRPLSE